MKACSKEKFRKIQKGQFKGSRNSVLIKTHPNTNLIIKVKQVLHNIWDIRNTRKGKKYAYWLRSVQEEGDIISIIDIFHILVIANEVCT